MLKLYSLKYFRLKERREKKNYGNKNHLKDGFNEQITRQVIK